MFNTPPPLSAKGVSKFIDWGGAANVMSLLALLNTQALGMTCLAEFVKAPASGGKSALSSSISKGFAVCPQMCGLHCFDLVFVFGVVFA